MSTENREIRVGEEEDGPRVDPLELIWALESSDRFERDSPLGGLFHQGQISFREMCPRDSMHIIDRDGVTAHVDPVSPLDCDPESPGQYSGVGVLVHNLTGMAADVASVFRGKKEVGMGTALLELLGRTRLFPLWAKRAIVQLLPLTGNRLVDTAMVSDLGDLNEPPGFGDDAGDTVEVWFSPPARMPLGLSVGAVTLPGRLHLSFRYRHRLFGDEATRRFADGYVAELETLIGDAAGGG